MTLKAIAGLLTPDQGRIVFDGQTLFDSRARSTSRRAAAGLAYLFQEYALFPHLTVRQNVAFGLDKGLRNPAPRRRQRRQSTAGSMRSSCSRSASAFRTSSRAASASARRVARALAAGARALLLDEPFAALDLSLRSRLRAELAELQQRLAIPILLITHDIADVEAFADEVVHIEGGRIRDVAGADCAKR